VKPDLDIRISSEAELQVAAVKILEFMGDRRIVLFDGPMGSGKTTVIKSLCRSLGSSDPLSSPTFSIVNEYSYPGGKIFHFDLYRVQDQNELYDIGIEEYIDSGEFCFFEWPEKVIDMIEIPYVEIQINPDDIYRYLRGSHK
jgi:tRNA threonylcarbamoyladenosine biosynthesis protein TsaE